MIARAKISLNLILSPPDNEADIKSEEISHGESLAKNYLDFLRFSDGIHALGSLNILNIIDIVQCNTNYEAQQYIPRYFMIGDDGDGIAILIKKMEERHMKSKWASWMRRQ